MHARKICFTLRNREENVQRKTTSPGFESRIFRILHALYPDVCADHRPVPCESFIKAAASSSPCSCRA